MLIRPAIGLQWVIDRRTIEVIVEVGLLLLLFIIGLEIDLPDVYAELRQRGIDCLYGDIAHTETLHHAAI